MQRAHALKFKGKYDANGRPDRYVAFAPARDLDEADIARLTNDEYRDITSGDRPLYVEVKAPEETKPEPRPKADGKASATKSDAPSPDAPRGK